MGSSAWQQEWCWAIVWHTTWPCCDISTLCALTWACTLTRACMQCRVMAACHRTMCPLTKAGSLTCPFQCFQSFHGLCIIHNGCEHIIPMPPMDLSCEWQFSLNPALQMVTAFTFADEHVINKLQSSVKAEKLCWVSELLSVGLKLSTPWTCEGD